VSKLDKILPLFGDSFVRFSCQNDEIECAIHHDDDAAARRHIQSRGIKILKIIRSLFWLSQDEIL
jgi:hypothetical protein